MNTPKMPIPSSREGAIVRIAQWWMNAVQVLERSLGAPVELFLRLLLAQGFFASAVLKLADWDTALLLAANEYPVTWLDYHTAAWLGLAIELLGSVLLAAGLATRFAACALLALTVVIQVEYRAIDAQLFWIALLAWIAVRGAGPLSLDRLLARGLADSALPFAAATLRILASITRRVEPVFGFALRLWLAATLLQPVFGQLLPLPPLFAALLPGSVTPALSNAFAASCALLLLAGLATRATAVLLALVVLLTTMTGAAGAVAPWWLITCLLLALRGAGRCAIDALLHATLCRRYPRLAGLAAFALEDVPHVVIVGAGFGGLSCAAKLARARVAVTLIDRHNYHLFQPLLYQVATAGLAPGDIATPVRGLFRDVHNVQVLLGEVAGVDSPQHEVRLADGKRVPYDYLVLATGAAHSYFGRDDWAPYAPGLKRVEDATDVRRRLLTAFERAESTDDAEERRSQLTFLIVGGGPTGVELAGAIAELARFGMEKEFRRYDPASARIVLIQAAPRLLPAFPEALSAETRRALEALGVEVMLDSRVESIDAEGVVVSGVRIASRTVLWAAGVIASPAAKWLGSEADSAGRVKVEANLSIPGHPNIFAIGDTTLSVGWAGKPVPGLAPAAKQGGEYVAHVIRAAVEGGTAPPAFAYRHLGSLATIGRKAAVADFGWVRLRGALAWWFWGGVHLAFLVGLRNRVSVMFDWFWAYLTLRSGTRLITGSIAAGAPLSAGDGAQPGNATARTAAEAGVC